MERVLTIISAANTINPCLWVLRTKGYDLTVTNRSDKTCLYAAAKDGRCFGGISASEVLGLVAMWEYFGDDWHDKLSVLPDMLDGIVVEDDVESS
jgi:hypothetical protein